MAKIDKRQYTKEEWKEIRQQRRIQKIVDRSKKETPRPLIPTKNKISFVLGNGTSRSIINTEQLQPHGKIYGCNALYRTFKPDYLVAVDVKMVLEINKSGYQHTGEVWTNPNKNFSHLKNFNYFSPSKGWSSGPTALWLASEHGPETIFILGFDYKGLDNGTRLNNIYADTMNYKKSIDNATFFGNWMRQTKNVIQTHKNINYVRVIAPDNYRPDELNTFDNYSEIFVEDFQKMFNISDT
jgi:hypothetical protein